MCKWLIFNVKVRMAILGKAPELPYIVIVRISTLIFVATYLMLRRDAVVVTSRCIRCYVGT